MPLRFSLEAMEIMGEKAQADEPFHAEDRDVDRPGFHEIWYRNGEEWKMNMEAFNEIRSIRRRVGKTETGYLTDVSISNQDQSGGSREKHQETEDLPKGKVI